MFLPSKKLGDSQVGQLRPFSKLGRENERQMPSVHPGVPAPKSGQYPPARYGGSVMTVFQGSRRPPTPVGGPWKREDLSKNQHGRWPHVVMDLRWLVPAQVCAVDEDLLADGQLRHMAGYSLSEHWLKPGHIRRQRRPDP
jgi:hypothetical protein